MLGNALELCRPKAVPGFAIVLILIILLWPAILNGFPVVYDDTSAYIGSLRSLRRFPAFYNVLPLLARVTGSLWFVVLAQALITAYIVARSLKLLAPGSSWPRALASAGMIAIASQLPWLTSYLMPDLFGGLGLLALITTVFAWSQLAFAERTLFLGLILFSGLVATANALVFLPVGAGLLIATWKAGKLARGLHRGLLLVGILMLVLPIASNWFLKAGPIFAGGSSARMFSKLVDNGLAVPFLEQHCAEERFRACEDLSLIRARVGGEGFLWKGPANAHDNLAWKDADGDYARLVHRIVIANPLAVARFMVRDSAVLASRVTLITADTGEIAPHPTGGVPFTLHRHFPNEDRAFARAKQQQGSLQSLFPERAYLISVICSLLFTLWCLWSFWRVQDRFPLSVTIWLLIAAAFAIAVHGSLSYPVTRYNVKVVWLLWIPPFLWWLRRLASHGLAASSDEPNGKSGDFRSARMSQLSGRRGNLFLEFRCFIEQSVCR